MAAPLLSAYHRRGDKGSQESKGSPIRIPGGSAPFSTPTRFPGSGRSSPRRCPPTSSLNETRPSSPQGQCRDMSVIDGLRPTVTRMFRANQVEVPPAPPKARPMSAVQAPTVHHRGRLPRPQSALLPMRPRSAPRSHPRPLMSFCRDDDDIVAGQLVDRRPQTTHRDGEVAELAVASTVSLGDQVTVESLRPPADAVPRPRRIVEKPCSPAVLVEVRGSVVEVRSRILDAALKQPALTGTTRWRLEMARMVELEQQSRLAPNLMCKSFSRQKRP